jgi:uncharacterized membrane protein YkgB
MGYNTASLPEVDFENFHRTPFLQRVRLLTEHWTEYGFGGPKKLNMLYVYKLVFYVAAGFTITWATTPGLGSIFEVSSWWAEPIVYQKLMVWTVLLEALGLASSSGPLAFKFQPMMGGALYWGRLKTLRVAPWPGKVPFTAGDHRTRWDVGLYYVILANLVFLLVGPGVSHSALPQSEAGMLPIWAMGSYAALIVLMGLRDKVVFLAARSEQYLLMFVFFATFAHFADMIIAVKIAIVVIWFGAGVSKFGPHFTSVVPPMVSNTPWITSKRFKRSFYRSYPEDLRYSRVAWGFAHLGGTVVELVLPLVLLFSTNTTITVLAIIGMWCFHLFIVSTFPIAVPLEWNIFFMFAAGFLFFGHPAQDGYAVGDMSSPWLLAAVLVATMFFPVLGNLRPDLVSFLPSMRQYAGNWATTMWAFRGDEAEEKLNTHIVKSNATVGTQFTAAYGKEISELLQDKILGWRSLHTQGRAMLSLHLRHLDSPDNYRIREGEVVCTTLVGWQFGDGHLHDERIISAVQRRCSYEPGELVVVYTESQPIHRSFIRYRVIDAALGVVETGRYLGVDAEQALPSLAGEPIRFEVDWTLPGYQPAGPALVASHT